VYNSKVRLTRTARLVAYDAQGLAGLLGPPGAQARRRLHAHAAGILCVPEGLLGLKVVFTRASCAKGGAGLPCMYLLAASGCKHAGHALQAHCAVTVQHVN
jgi:hypothetical protein